MFFFLVLPCEASSNSGGDSSLSALKSMSEEQTGKRKAWDLWQCININIYIIYIYIYVGVSTWGINETTIEMVNPVTNIWILEVPPKTHTFKRSLSSWTCHAVHLLVTAEQVMWSHMVLLSVHVRKHPSGNGPLSCCQIYVRSRWRAMCFSACNQLRQHRRALNPLRLWNSIATTFHWLGEFCDMEYLAQSISTTWCITLHHIYTHPLKKNPCEFLVDWPSTRNFLERFHAWLKYHWGNGWSRKRCRITYSSTLNACGRGEEWQKALEIFAEAERKGTLNLLGLGAGHSKMQCLWVDCCLLKSHHPTNGMVSSGWKKWKDKRWTST